MDTKNKLIKVKGIIIKEADYKDYDKLLTLLTKEYGRISVYAFGVRKPNSKNIGKIRKFCFLTLELRIIKNRYQLESIWIDKSFDELASDYDDICYASYFIELADYFALENESMDETYRLIYYTFKALVDKKIDRKLIKRIYELKILKYQGIYLDTSDLHYESLKYTWDFVIKTPPQKLYSFRLDDRLEKMFFDVVDLEMKEKVNKRFTSI